ncbi:Histidinol dehydrogenase [invertebrate metagenome]|uniref:Histidinol dehydrogenase n=1 Tax=invertebrate metagenome TaxID=1711999 RepID=A0A484H7E8_9ZZZZ
MAVELFVSAADFPVTFAALLARKRERNADVDGVVRTILADVQTRGDEAVLDYTRRFDHIDLTASDLLVSLEEQNTYADIAPTIAVAALELAAGRIRDFHCRQKPVDLDYVDAAGVQLGQRWTPIESVGLYVPGGTTSYPSSVLMNALPAQMAGVPRVVMVVPTPDGHINPLVFAAARIAGVDEIYRIGGAQAVAALAYGTATLVPVDKIVGPGNAYVAAAKRQVFGQVGIDMIAGPSEIVVVADGANDPDWIAADLISQAEHDTTAQAILITDDCSFGQQVARAIDSLLASLPRVEIARASWDHYGVIIIVETLEQAVPLVDALAPEHLELAVADPEALAVKVHHAGAIFLGRHTPEAVGDYVGGPNHVLPTACSARFSSGLSVLDFLKRTTLLSCDSAALARIGPTAITLAMAENLHAHGRAVAIRLRNTRISVSTGDS